MNEPKGHTSLGATGINLLVDKCHTWLNNRTDVKYLNHEALALDFGKNGTSKFFPLSLMTQHLRNDYRFSKYVIKDKI